MSGVLVLEINCSMEILYHELEKVKIKNPFVNAHRITVTIYVANRKFANWVIAGVLLKIKFSIGGRSSLLRNVSNSVQLDTF